MDRQFRKYLNSQTLTIEELYEIVSQTAYDFKKTIRTFDEVIDNLNSIEVTSLGESEKEELITKLDSLEEILMNTKRKIQ